MAGLDGNTVGIVLNLGVEILRFYMNSKELQGKTPEEVLEAWKETRADVMAAEAAWRSSG